MPIAGFEPRIPLFEKLNIAHALDHMTILTRVGQTYSSLYSRWGVLVKRQL
jgi:hypothetical protein